MKHKKILSAVMAMAMLGSMQAIAVSAEETENTESIETVGNIENSENNNSQEQDQNQNSSQESETIPEATDAPATDGASQTEPESSVTTQQTDAPATTVVTTIATPATSKTDSETISSELEQPELGDFKVTTGSDGESAVISWDAVDGADGYQVYRTVVEEKDPDTPTSYTFDVKGTSYQTSGSIPYKETIKVRAFKLVNDEKIYSTWSENRTIYLNGMKDPGSSSSEESTTTVATVGNGNNSSETTTTKSSTTTTKATTKEKSTTSSDTEQKTGSPKTGDPSSVGLLLGASATAALAAVMTRKKK
ncbi:MAG: LPXTG cell wall anchor domain-containing protein [Oscillospiraceae bacterium]|nr:LPXTG cell wall anchor domain-containing protein [Oscillospiraceae bacterium]